MCVSLLSILSINDLLGDGCRESVKQQGNEQSSDEEDQGYDDVFLVIPPDQVEETLEGVHEPGKGGVGAADG